MRRKKEDNGVNGKLNEVVKGGVFGRSLCSTRDKAKFFGSELNLETIDNLLSSLNPISGVCLK